MAVPNPEQELARLKKAVPKGLPPLLLISGPAGFFRTEAMDLVVAALPKDADVRHLTGDRDTDGDELQDLRGASLFGRGCWLVVRRAKGWIERHGERLVAALDHAAPGCGVILETAKLDKRTKVGKRLAKGEVFEFRDLYDKPYDRNRSPLEAEMVSWIVTRGRAHGVPLTSEAALLLMTMVGTDPSELVAELQRLSPRIEGKNRLTPEDIQSMLSCSFESTPFEFAEALLDRDRNAANRSLEAMFRRGVRGRDGDTVDRGGLFPFITSWTHQALANAYQGRFLLDRGVSLREVPKQVGVRAFIPRFQSQVQGNSGPQLRRGLEQLHEAQRELRLTGEDPLWILRRFVQRYFASA